MEMLARQIANGLAVGTLYGLMALGLVLIYNTAEVVNFGHGDIAAFCTFLGYTLLVSQKWPPLPAVILVLLTAAILGVLIESLVLRPVRLQRAPVLALVVVTLGVAQVLNGSIGILWGRQVKSLPPLIVGPPVHVGEIVIAREQLLNLAVGLTLAITLFLFLRLSKYGIALRAVAQNPVAARLVGIGVNRMLAIAWALGAGLGAVAGLLIAPITFLEPDTMNFVLIRAFAAAVLGGFNSLLGALVGGLLLGILENLVAGYIATELKTAFAFALIVLVLAIHPAGLFGQERTRKV